MAYPHASRTSPAFGVRPVAAGRLSALDGLRGIAALVVVIDHALLTSPVLAEPYPNVKPDDLPLWAQVLTYTPVHIVWAGTEAVWVFFVLSGLVLSLPFFEGRPVPWRQYYPQRLLRLYLPIFGAVAFACTLLQFGDRSEASWRGYWLNTHPDELVLSDVVRDLTVIRGAGSTNSALWSLQWEILFSLILPCFVFLLIRISRHPVLHLVGVLTIIGYGLRYNHQSVVFTGMFALGALMAKHRAALTEVGRSLDAASPKYRWLFVLGTVLLLTAQWPLLATAGLVWAFQFGTFLAVVGATATVWYFACTTGGTFIGDRPAVQWLGQRSFSLYLVHEPIVVTTGFLLGTRLNAPTVLLIALPVSLLLAAAFYRVIERPSHRAARRVGVWASSRRGS